MTIAAAFGSGGPGWLWRAFRENIDSRTLAAEFVGGLALCDLNPPRDLNGPLAADGNVRRCARCGAREDRHHYRHPFVSVQN